MYIEIDLSTVPLAVSLAEADDFKGFKVVVKQPEHSFVDRAELRRLAGARADDPDWQANLERMLAYAGTKGWIDDRGAIQAHVNREET